MVRDARRRAPHHEGAGSTCGKLARRAKIRFFRRANHLYNYCHPVPLEGRRPSLPNVGTGVAVDVTASCARRIAGRDQLRERSLERADERCRSVRQRRVDLTPQCLASSLAEVQRLNRAGVPSSGRRRGHERPIPRGERVISRRAIAQGMSDVLRCPVCSCAPFLQLRTRDRGCSAHPTFPAPSFFRGGQRHENLGQIVPRECGPTSV